MKSLPVLLVTMLLLSFVPAQAATTVDAGETFPQFLPKAVAKWRSFMPRQA